MAKVIMMNSKSIFLTAGLCAVLAVPARAQLTAMPRPAPAETMETRGDKSEAETTKQPAAFTFEVWGDIPNVENDLPEKHYLGGEVTLKWNTFLKNFTRKYDVSIGFSDSGYETLKPSVSNAVRRANKWVKKCLERQHMTREEAVRTMTHVLDCANTIVFEPETEKFEAAAAKANSGQEALALFMSTELVGR